MPEKVVQTAQAIAEWGDAIVQACVFAGIGMLTALGQLLASKEVLTWRIVVGRCLSTAGIGMAAGTVLLVIPGVPPIAQIGVAAALASLGTSGLERLIQRAIGARSEP